MGKYLSILFRATWYQEYYPELAVSSGLLFEPGLPSRFRSQKIQVNNDLDLYLTRENGTTVL